MPTPGMIATDMQQALADLEAAQARLNRALGLAMAPTPPLRHHNRAYVDMLRTRQLADWLTQVADALDGPSPDDLSQLTKAQLLALAAERGVAGLSEAQRKDELIAALTAGAAEG